MVSRVPSNWMLAATGIRPAAAATLARITCLRSSMLSIGNSPPAAATSRTPRPVRIPRSTMNSMFVRSESRSSSKLDVNGVATDTMGPRNNCFASSTLITLQPPTVAAHPVAAGCHSLQ